MSKESRDLNRLLDKQRTRFFLPRSGFIQRGGHMSHPDPQGFLAVPPNGTGRGVLVLHPWWGLNETIRAFCTRLAREGFVAFAPDLYHGKLATTIDGAKGLATSLDRQQASVDIANAVRFLKDNESVCSHGLAVIGFSLGATYALGLSVADPEQIRAVVVFYGTASGNYGASKARYLGHFAEKDEYEPEADVNEFEEALRQPRYRSRSITIKEPGTGSSSATNWHTTRRQRLWRGNARSAF